MTYRQIVILDRCVRDPGYLETLTRKEDDDIAHYIESNVLEEIKRLRGGLIPAKKGVIDASKKHIALWEYYRVVAIPQWLKTLKKLRNTKQSK